jgi:hypothetical protein
MVGLITSRACLAASLDERKRASLAKIARHGRYLVTVEPDAAAT